MNEVAKTGEKSAHTKREIYCETQNDPLDKQLLRNISGPKKQAEYSRLLALSRAAHAVVV